MKVLIDTNILISAALCNNGTPYRAFIKAVSYPNHGLVCEQNIDEMRRIFNRKFPKKIQALETFLSLAFYLVLCAFYRNCLLYTYYLLFKTSNTSAF